MTTAGSNDVMAFRSETHAVAAVLMIVGLAFAAILTGAIAQRFIVTEDTVTQGNRETLARQVITHEKLDELTERLSRLEAALNATAQPGVPPERD